MNSEQDQSREQRRLQREAARDNQPQSKREDQRDFRKVLFLVGAVIALVLVGFWVLRDGQSKDEQTASRVRKSAQRVVTNHTSHNRRHRPSSQRSRGLAPWSGTGPQVSGSQARKLKVPILMYHVISTPKPGVSLPELWVAPQRFAAQINTLAKQGYVGVTLEQVLHAWKSGAPLPKKPVVISFDDGYLSHYTHALPILRKQNWPGVLKLKLGNVGADGIPASGVRALVAAGWEIDSHTLTHPDLTTLPAAALRRELVGSRQEIQNRFHQPANLFCYPAGKYNENVIRAVRAAGYRAATTVDSGYGQPTASERFRLRRIRINGDDSAEAVLKQLS